MNTLIFTLIASRIKQDKRGVYTISYIHANQPIPRRNNPPWAYSDIEADLLLLTQPLPARFSLSALTVERPLIAIHGTWALVTQHLFYV